MAYVIVYHKDQEIARRELDGAVTLGRSPDCELSVHDIMLSRRHCRIEPDGEGWAMADLGSKNGTRVGGNSIVRSPLQHGDVIRMGKTVVRFRTGPFVAAIKPRTPGVRRPADPIEALAGTVRDFQYRPPRVQTNGIPFPTPQPSPMEPAAYVDEDVRSLVSELVSSSWDTIYQGASRPDPMVTHAHSAAELAVRRARPRQPRIDFSLQVQPEIAEQVLTQSPPLPIQEADASMFEPKIDRAAHARKARAVLNRLAPIFQWLAVLPLLWVR
jgi:predicted component of type VI protein secretion system